VWNGNESYILLYDCNYFGTTVVKVVLWGW
jgi:hypothetical protein